MSDIPVTYYVNIKLSTYSAQTILDEAKDLEKQKVDRSSQKEANSAAVSAAPEKFDTNRKTRADAIKRRIEDTTVVVTAAAAVAAAAIKMTM